jgi:hypothetical protein
LAISKNINNFFSFGDLRFFGSPWGRGQTKNLVCTDDFCFYWFSISVFSFSQPQGVEKTGVGLVLMFRDWFRFFGSPWGRGQTKNRISG